MENYNETIIEAQEVEEYSQHLRPGTLLQKGKYKIVRFIKSGGFGCTYEAVNTTWDNDNRRVAIKELFVSDFCNRNPHNGSVTVHTKSKQPLFAKLRKKFLTEATNIENMTHSGIVQVKDYFEENGTAYYVMNYIEGYSLSDLIKRKGALSEEEALHYMRQVADALQYVHGCNLLHLDIKPGNVMINGKNKAILIDFGVSKQYDEESGENTSSVMGHSPGYAPPEQNNNSIGKFLPATDIYSLGATLYTLLTGKVPTSSSELAAGEKLPPLPASVSPSTRRAVMAAMNLNKLTRPQSISQFLSLLDGKQSGNHPWLWVAVVGVLIGVGIAVSSIVKPDNVQEDNRQETAEVVEKADEIIEQVAEEIKETPAVTTRHGGNLDIIASLSYDDMVYVEGGEFMMGAQSTSSSSAYYDYEAEGNEAPVHNVSLSSYYIGKYEVTQQLWEYVMNYSGAAHDGTVLRPVASDPWLGDSNPSSSYGKGDYYPAYFVSYNDIVNHFLPRLNKITGKTYRLPTEAEWEYAARGGKKSQERRFSGHDDVNEVAWYNGNSTHPVGQKTANELGLHDMSGNVWEWCADSYNSTYYSSSPRNNPRCDGSADSNRVLRGGSWFNNASSCRVSNRNHNSPSYRGSNYGFRVVCVP